MILGAVIQQPIDVLDYDIEYEDWLGTDAISTDPGSVTVTITPNTGTLDVEPIIVTDPGSDPNMVKLWIQGGLDDEEYTVEINVTTVAGRTKQDELLVQIKDFI